MLHKVMRTCHLRAIHSSITALQTKVPNKETSQLAKTNESIQMPLLQSGLRMEELKDRLRMLMGRVTLGRKSLPTLKEREHLNTFHVDDQTMLPSRNISDSFLTATVPLGSDEKLQEMYTSTWGNMRLGRLVEDMDLFALMVLQKYILNPNVPADAPSPYTILTIVMDSMLMSNYNATPHEDIRISGHVANVGTATAEVIVWLEQKFNDEWQNFTQARFVLTARDATNRKAVFINPLVPSDINERSLMKISQDDRRKILERNCSSLDKLCPTLEENKELHSMFTKHCRGCVFLPECLPPGYKWMSETNMSSTLLSFPENRSHQNKVFSGYLMRKAIELGYTTCYMFTHQRGQLRGISEVRFNDPVPIGSVVEMNSQIAYTKDNYIQVVAHANATNRQEGTLFATNTFQFTFEMPVLVNPVYPKTYREAMQFVEGCRHLNCVMQMNKEPFYIIDFNAPNKQTSDTHVSDKNDK